MAPTFTPPPTKCYFRAFNGVKNSFPQLFVIDNGQEAWLEQYVQLYSSKWPFIDQI